jgi:1-acyl-sn-glycerol-3-phosphate acyltransferase
VRGTVRTWRAIATLAFQFALVSLCVPLVSVPAIARRLLPAFRRSMPRALLRSLGVRVHAVGRTPDGPCLLVSNHLGWIDALAYSSLAGPVFVALARRWPLISFIMKVFGTISVGRDDISVLPRANRALARANRSGERTMVFPEGNSYWGFGVMPFKAPLLQSAIDAGVPVYAASMRYETPRPWPPASRVACWTDFTSFLAHVARVARLPRVDVTIRWSDRPLRAVDRKALAGAARAEVLRIFTPTS